LNKGKIIVGKKSKNNQMCVLKVSYEIKNQKIFNFNYVDFGN